jgi:hypothetical protein
MQISSLQLKAYNRQKTESLIRDSKCFFLLQLYDLTSTEIDALRVKISPLRVRLIRFPLINWKRTPTFYFRTAGHIPLHNSNYALLGDNQLSLEAFAVLRNLLERERVIFIVGYNDGMWFNPQRLWDPELDKRSSTQFIDVLQSNLQTFPTHFSILHQLLQSLEFFSYRLK